jgi:hypothetical protein
MNIMIITIQNSNLGEGGLRHGRVVDEEDQGRPAPHHVAAATRILTDERERGERDGGKGEGGGAGNGEREGGREKREKGQMLATAATRIGQRGEGARWIEKESETVGERREEGEVGPPPTRPAARPPTHPPTT